MKKRGLSQLKNEMFASKTRGKHHKKNMKEKKKMIKAEVEEEKMTEKKED